MDNPVVLGAIDPNLSVQKIVRYAKAQGPTIAPKRIMKHKDGYFLLQYNTNAEGNKVVEVYTYYINKNPILVKSGIIFFYIVSEMYRKWPV